MLICAFRPGNGSLAGSLGGLLLGAHDPATGDLAYIGDVGTGLTQAQRTNLLAALQPLERSTHPFADAPPRDEVVGACWVAPRPVGEVEYREFSRAGRLRHAA